MGGTETEFCIPFVAPERTGSKHPDDPAVLGCCSQGFILSPTGSTVSTQAQAACKEEEDEGDPA